MPQTAYAPTGVDVQPDIRVPMTDRTTPSANRSISTDISQMESSAFINAPCWDSGDYTTTP